MRWSGLLTALVMAVIAVAACGGTDQSTSGSVKDNLVLTGPVKADSSGEKGGSCVWRPAIFNLKFSSGSMQGGAVVSFDVTLHVGAIGDVSAVDPSSTSDGSTALMLAVAGKKLKATDGMVHVTDSDLQEKTWKGTIDGTFEDGTKISGSWSCSAVLG